MSGPFGTRRVDITSMARARMTADEKHEVDRTCRERGFRLSLMWSLRERRYVCALTVGGRTYAGSAALPMDAWRRALAQRDEPLVEIVGLLS